MTEPTKDQTWKEEARKAYQDQQSQDNEGGCRESIGFVQGFLAAKKSDFQEIKTLKEQLESANAVIHHVVYSTEDSQGLAYEYLELNKSKEINNEK